MFLLRLFYARSLLLLFDIFNIRTIQQNFSAFAASDLIDQMKEEKNHRNYARIEIRQQMWFLWAISLWIFHTFETAKRKQ